MRGIKNPTDIFQNVPVLGRLRDLKLTMILVRIEPDASSHDSSSNEDEYISLGSESEENDNMNQGNKSMSSHTVTEKS